MCLPSQISRVLTIFPSELWGFLRDKWKYRAALKQGMEPPRRADSLP